MVAVYIPPIDVSGDEVADVLAAVGEQSDKPLVSSFLGAEGVPELLRVPDVAGLDGRPRLGAVVPRRRVGRAGARRASSEYAVWLRTPNGPAVMPDDLDAAAARGARPAAADRAPRRPRARRRRAADPAGGLRHRPVGAAPVTTLAEATKAGRDLGWDVVLKATTDRLRERPDLAHVWRNIDSPAEMRDAWESLSEIITDPDDARASWCRRTRRPASR